MTQEDISKVWIVRSDLKYLLGRLGLSTCSGYRNLKDFRDFTQKIQSFANSLISSTTTTTTPPHTLSTVKIKLKLS